MRNPLKRFKRKSSVRNQLKHQDLQDEKSTEASQNNDNSLPSPRKSLQSPSSSRSLTSWKKKRKQKQDQKQRGSSVKMLQIQDELDRLHSNRMEEQSRWEQGYQQQQQQGHLEHQYFGHQELPEQPKQQQDQGQLQQEQHAESTAALLKSKMDSLNQISDALGEFPAAAPFPAATVSQQQRLSPQKQQQEQEGQEQSSEQIIQPEEKIVAMGPFGEFEQGEQQQEQHAMRQPLPLQLDDKASGETMTRSSPMQSFEANFGTFTTQRVDSSHSTVHPENTPKIDNSQRQLQQQQLNQRDHIEAISSHCLEHNPSFSIMDENINVTNDSNSSGCNNDINKNDSSDMNRNVANIINRYKFNAGITNVHTNDEDKLNNESSGKNANSVNRSTATEGSEKTNDNSAIKNPTHNDNIDGSEHDNKATIDNSAERSKNDKPIRKIKNAEPHVDRIAKAAVALDNAGNELFERGDYDRAMASYVRALKLKNRTLLAVQLAREEEQEKERERRTEQQQQQQQEEEEEKQQQQQGNTGGDNAANGENASTTDSNKKSTKAKQSDLWMSVATSINNIGYLRQQSGAASADETMQAYLNSLQIKRSILGNDNLSVGKTLNNLGTVYYLKKEYENALNSYNEALQIMINSLGDDHLDVGTVHSNIADVHYAKMDSFNALYHYRHAFNIRWKHLGEHDPKVIRLLNKIASLEMGELTNNSPRNAINMHSTASFADDISEIDDFTNLHSSIGREISQLDLKEREVRTDMVKDRVHLRKGMKLLHDHSETEKKDASTTASSTAVNEEEEQQRDHVAGTKEKLLFDNSTYSVDGSVTSRPIERSPALSPLQRQEALLSVRERLVRLREARLREGTGSGALTPVNERLSETMATPSSSITMSPMHARHSISSVPYPRRGFSITSANISDYSSSVQNPDGWQSPRNGEATAVAWLHEQQLKQKPVTALPSSSMRSLSTSYPQSSISGLSTSSQRQHRQVPMTQLSSSIRSLSQSSERMLQNGIENLRRHKVPTATPTKASSSQNHDSLLMGAAALKGTVEI